jgi:hypothetical protein
MGPAPSLDRAVWVPKHHKVEHVISPMVRGADNFGTKHQDTLRYCLANINGLPLGDNHDKHDLIIQAMAKYQIDILGLAEININFNRVGPTNQWKDRLTRPIPCARAYLDSGVTMVRNFAE